MGRKTAVCIAAWVQPVWRLTHAVLLPRYGDKSASPLMFVEIDVTLPVYFIRLWFKLLAVMRRGKENSLMVLKYKQIYPFTLLI